MSCLLTSGIVKGCKTGIGGTKRFLLTNKSNVVSVSGATDGLITSITMSAGTTFHEFVTNKFSSSWSDNPSPVAQNSGTAYIPTINMNFAKNEATKRNAVKLLGQAEVVALVQNADGTWFYLGESNGLELIASTYNSGVAVTDANNWTIVMAGGEPNPSQEVDASVIAGIL